MRTTDTMKFELTNEDGSKKEITFLFTQLKPSQSIKVITYLTKILGTTAGKALGSVNGFKAEDIENLSMDKLGDAIAQLFVSLDDDTLIDKMNILLQSVTHENNVITVDYPFFTGRIDILLKVLKKALEVNFKHFLEGNSGLLEKIKGTLKIIQKVAPTSIGTSGAQ